MDGNNKDDKMRQLADRLSYFRLVRCIKKQLFFICVSATGEFLHSTA